MHSLSASKCSRGAICSPLVEIGLTNYSTRFFLYKMFFLQGVRMETNFFMTGRRLQDWKKNASQLIKPLKLPNQQERTAESIAGLSEKRISQITGKKLSHKVHNARFSSALSCPSKKCPITRSSGSCRHAKVSR